MTSSALPSPKISKVIHELRNFGGYISSSIVITVPTGGLTLLSARPYAGTVMT